MTLAEATDYLKTTLRYHPSTVSRHCRNWRWIKKFMDSRQIKQYELNTEKQILYHRFGSRNILQLTRHEKEVHNSIKMITEFAFTGAIKVIPRILRRDFVFTGVIGVLISQFLEYKKITDRLSKTRFSCYERYLHRFLQYCQKKNVHSVKEIDLVFVIHFIRDLDCTKGSPVGTIICTIRNFIKYLYLEKHLDVDYADKIPRTRSVEQSKLPSTYTKREIEKLIKSVERSSASGKRNYAIILIAARLGLRASDIARLQFDNLKWNISTIEITMVKTGKRLMLPLLPDVGNAIIDYLKYARPQSGEPFVFLTERPPYGCFSSSNVVTHVVQRAFRKAGIDITNRKFGPHSLRHSLGYRMLEQSTILPVISEVFGHKSSESTRYYLRIDIESMKQCMLDVPPITDKFYNQKGGLFYV
ncbi:MAG: site-specific integrase [Niabella sp.]